jgi:hypothetical protein
MSASAVIPGLSEAESPEPINTGGAERARPFQPCWESSRLWVPGSRLSLSSGRPKAGPVGRAPE